VAAGALQRRLLERANLCSRCWHDAVQRCICSRLATDLALSLPIRCLVLMHYKEYYKASDDAKLLPAMLAPGLADIFTYGVPGELDRLQAELAVDPEHTLILWPGDDSLTIEQFVASLPTSSPWHRPLSSAETADRVEASAQEQHNGTRPMLRVVVLDAVYRHARTMFRHLHKTAAEGLPPPKHVALHPRTLSVYKRAQNGYAQASAKSTAKSADPEALRICTVEAYALLLEELGEPKAVPQQLVQAVVINNEALECLESVAPRSNPTGRRARRRHHLERERAAAEAHPQACAAAGVDGEVGTERGATGCEMASSTLEE